MLRILDAGSGIRCLFNPWIRDPVYAKHQDPDPGSGSGINPTSYFLELGNNFVGLKILEFYDLYP
jgi:hypothetical protein